MDTTTTASDLAQLTPAAVDERWAAALAPAYRLHTQLAEARRSLARYRKWGQQPEHLHERISDLTTQLAEARAVEAPFLAEFERRGGWTRYLLVAGAGGHVHRAPGSCSTLRPTTLVQPVFALSGRSAQEVIGELGETACSVCFPDAPVQTREQRERATAARRAAKAAERETNRREKLARSAVRARKLMVKVAAAYEALGGQEAVFALPRTGPDSAYGKTWELPTTVQDVILGDVREFHGEQRWGRDPREVIREADALGL